MAELDRRYAALERQRLRNIERNKKEARSVENLLAKGTNFKDDPKRASTASNVINQIDDSGGMRQNISNKKITASSSPLNDMGIDPNVKNKKLLDKLKASEAEELFNKADEIPSNKIIGNKPRFGKLLSKIGPAMAAANLGQKALAGDSEGFKRDAIKEAVEFGTDKALDVVTGTNPLLLAARYMLSSPDVQASTFDPNNPKDIEEMEKMQAKTWGNKRFNNLKINK